jgi:hypothetical protein
MNIDDVTALEIPEGSIMEAMYDHQMSLMEKYDEIETRNGFEVPKKPWHPDDPKVQARLKDLFWRFTEELAESMEHIHEIELYGNWTERWSEDAKLRHLFEEMADALHFLIEASIMGGIEWSDIKGWDDRSREGIYYPDADINPICIRDQIAKVVIQLGLAANTLKNKPWKSTHMETDKKRFKKFMLSTWMRFIELWHMFGCDLTQIWQLYSRKKQVNEFRQGSNY